MKYGEIQTIAAVAVVLCFTVIPFLGFVVYLMAKRNRYLMQRVRDYRKFVSYKWTGDMDDGEVKLLDQMPSAEAAEKMLDDWLVDHKKAEPVAVRNP